MHAANARSECPQRMIDRLLSFDPGGRGIASFFVPGGAARAARALRRAKRVLLTTGFSLGPGLPETDGPPGTASLGRALRALGAEVTYITDAASLPPLQAALAVLGEPTQVLTFHAGGDATLTARRLLAEHAPTHLVAIERPGRTRGGAYLSMRGEPVGEWNAALDELFLQAPRRVVTVGVGDGGNEIGMGALRARLSRAGARIAKVASVVPARHPVVAGVSNWG
ncbi:MAG: glutamate cyclase domain-containing protein, partial [Gemmatimonadales bacterium]